MPMNRLPSSDHDTDPLVWECDRCSCVIENPRPTDVSTFRLSVEPRSQDTKEHGLAHLLGPRGRHFLRNSMRTVLPVTNQDFEVLIQTNSTPLICTILCASCTVDAQSYQFGSNLAHAIHLDDDHDDIDLP